MKLYSNSDSEPHLPCGPDHLPTPIIDLEHNQKHFFKKV